MIPSPSNPCPACEPQPIGGYACTKNEGCALVAIKKQATVEYKAIAYPQMVALTCKIMLAVMRAHDLGNNSGADIELQLLWREFERDISTRVAEMFGKLKVAP